MDDRGVEQLYLVIDQGGHSSRALVMDRSGRPVAEARQPLGTSRPLSGYVEHDPVELLDTVRHCLAEIARRDAAAARRIRSAGLATQRSSIVCWDRISGDPLSPVISWQDTRAGERIDALLHIAGPIHERTGLFLSAHYGASKMAWCLENLDRVRKARDDGRLLLGPLSSYISWHLTDEKLFLADPVSASRTLLYNIHDGGWDPYLLDAFKVPVECLPACTPTIHHFGSLVVGGPPVPLTMVTGDQSAAMYAQGELSPDTGYVNMGTGAFLSRTLGAVPLLSERLLTSVLHEQEGKKEFALEGTVNGAGSALRWIQTSLGIRDLEDRLPGWLEEVDDPPLFLNGVSGVGSPYWSSDFETGFVGKGGDAQKVVAVAQSIVFLLYRNLEEMNRHLPPPERIRISGGLSSLDGVCQLLSDLSGVNVYRPGEMEATARGTCYLLAGKPDLWEESAPGSSFEPAGGASIARRYGNWVQEMERRLETIRAAP